MQSKIVKWIEPGVRLNKDGVVRASFMQEATSEQEYDKYVGFQEAKKKLKTV